MFLYDKHIKRYCPSSFDKNEQKHNLEAISLYLGR